MQITINGTIHSFRTALSIEALAEYLQLNPRQVAIERNREIVPRSRYGEVIVNDGDRIEIVQFIGGG